MYVAPNVRRRPPWSHVSVPTPDDCGTSGTRSPILSSPRYVADSARTRLSVNANDIAARNSPARAAASSSTPRFSIRPTF
jgi:hypothetical protein